MDFKGIKLGFKAALISSSCCTLPLAFVLVFGVLGAGSMTAALKIPKFKTYFIVLGLVFLAVSIYLSIKRKCGGACSISDVHKYRSLVVVSVLSYLILTLLVIYVLLPVVAVWLIG
ncbi:MAG: hypothetical protein ABH851_04375 [Methanobacteriota archaeon]